MEKISPFPSDQAKPDLKSYILRLIIVTWPRSKEAGYTAFCIIFSM